MAFVLAVLGGAAAVELSKLLSKDQKVSVKELEVLQSKEEELQEVLQVSVALRSCDPRTLQHTRSVGAGSAG